MIIIRFSATITLVLCVGILCTIVTKNRQICPLVISSILSTKTVLVSTKQKQSKGEYIDHREREKNISFHDESEQYHLQNNCLEPTCMYVTSDGNIDFGWIDDT